MSAPPQLSNCAPGDRAGEDRAQLLHDGGWLVMYAHMDLANMTCERMQLELNGEAQQRNLDQLVAGQQQVYVRAARPALFEYEHPDIDLREVLDARVAERVSLSAIAQTGEYRAMEAMAAAHAAYDYQRAMSMDPPPLQRVASAMGPVLPDFIQPRLPVVGKLPHASICSR
nr:hypothetical protein [Crucivirus sp.]